MRTGKSNRQDERFVMCVTEKLDRLCGVNLVRHRIAVMSAAKLPWGSAVKHGPAVLASIGLQILNRPEAITPAAYLPHIFRKPRRQHAMTPMIRVPIIRKRPEIRGASIARKTIFILINRHDFMPVMLNLSGGKISVSMPREQLEQGGGLFDNRIVMPAVVLLIRPVEPGGDRVQSAPHAGARRPADRNI